MPLHSIQMLHIWGAQPVALAKIRMALGLAITDNQHPRHGMTTFVRQMLPASDIPVPQAPSGRVHKYIASLGGDPNKLIPHRAGTQNQIYPPPGEPNFGTDLP